MSNKLIKVSSDAVRNPQPLCHLNITSDETGAVSAQAVYVGGFDLNIPAWLLMVSCGGAFKRLAPARSRL